MLTKLQVKGEECIFIDDQVNNLRAARELGIATIQFITAEQLEKDLKKLGVKLS